jgi:dUTP pyrophosphatase
MQVLAMNDQLSKAGALHWPERINIIGQNGNNGEHYVKIKLLTENAKAPERATEHAAGYDIFCNEHITLIPGARALISTGFAMSIPHGKVALIWPRSGLAGKHGVDSLAGVVDSDYRGEVRVALINHGHANIEFKAGDRIAQMLIQDVYQEQVVIVDNLDETQRGAGGFGSTGY